LGHLQRPERHRLRSFTEGGTPPDCQVRQLL
jgi:hypothetical protein